MKLADDATLIASELITNACTATPEGKIRIRFIREQASVLLGVWDSCDEMPQVRETDLDLCEEGGWGLPLVQALSAEFGVTKTDPNGKWAWARLAC